MLIDKDKVLNAEDNCPDKANLGQKGADNDGTGDVCDADTIYGTIIGAAAGVKVKLFSVGCGFDFIYEKARTNSEVYYSFESIPKGLYVVLPKVSLC